MAKLVKVTEEQWPVGDPMDEGTVLGSLIEESALTRCTAYVDGAVADGAVVATGVSDGLCKPYREER